jgi:hypothetical protein
VFIVGEPRWCCSAFSRSRTPVLRCLARHFLRGFILVDGPPTSWLLQNREKDGWWIPLLMNCSARQWGPMRCSTSLSILAFILIVAFEATLPACCSSFGYKVRKTTSREWVLYLTVAVDPVRHPGHLTRIAGSRRSSTHRASSL